MARYTNEPEQRDDCGHCTLLPTVSGWARAVQVSCPEHSEHPTAMRVRTQAERDADGQTWRPGPQPSPECMASLPAVHADCDNDMGCTCTCHPPLEQARARIARVLAEDLPAIGAVIAELTDLPPRRRWWHRLTRRNP